MNVFNLMILTQTATVTIFLHNVHEIILGTIIERQVLASEITIPFVNFEEILDLNIRFLLDLKIKSSSKREHLEE